MADRQSFFGGLGDAIATGWQATRDAFDEDISSMERGKLPRQAGKVAMDALSAMQSPSTIGFIPKVPTYFNPHFEYIDRLLNGVKGVYTPEQLQLFRDTLLNRLTTEELAAAKPTGKFVAATGKSLFGQK